jgi:hypothetical protein
MRSYNKTQVKPASVCSPNEAPFAGAFLEKAPWGRRWFWQQMKEFFGVRFLN